ncbi:MAG TPA: hypothetical protein VNW06_09955, partial [Cytophagaceae bacterium]|nr:hypothetical protein [Cytophagaceae bacterium]
MLKNIVTKANLPYLLPIFLVLPALLIHLGSMPLVADEPTRALVALEMLISKNYIVPTINGEYYYNKPPLYNWMLVGLYHLTGHINEWVIRIPTVIFTLLFSVIMFWFIRKYTDFRIAFIVAVAYVTSGRILFYDSFLGLIDTIFSTLVFLNFMLIYHFDQKKQYHFLFLITYFITAITYMLKGLPGPVFQIITLFVFFIFIKRNFKMLFHIYHWLGIFTFIFLVSLYYVQYLKYNTLETVINTIISESTKRTVVKNNPLDSLMHILFFPVITILNFLPFTVPFILIIKKINFKTIINHSFLKYCLLVLLANSIVYWLSPETVPRYLFMFLPLMYAISYVLYFEVANMKFKIMYEHILFGISILIILIFLTVPFISIVPEVSLKYPKLIFLIASLSALLFYYYKNKTDKIIIFCSILLLARIGFDWYVFPSRLQTEPQVAYRNYGISIGKITKGKPLYIYKYSPVDHDISFYISRE